jgi:predicted NUDIX family NTP pyrophosphohydrolase
VHVTHHSFGQISAFPGAENTRYFSTCNDQLDGEFIELGQSKQPSKTTVHTRAFEKDIDEAQILSNTSELERPKTWRISMNIWLAHEQADA